MIKIKMYAWKTAGDIFSGPQSKVTLDLPSDFGRLIYVVEHGEAETVCFKLDDIRIENNEMTLRSVRPRRRSVFYEYEINEYKVALIYSSCEEEKTGADE